MTTHLDLELKGDGKWAAFPVWEDDDPQPWVERVVDGYAKRRRVRCTPQERMVLVQSWSAMVEAVRSRREDEDRWMASAFGFVPMGSASARDLIPMTVAHLTGVRAGRSRDGFVEDLVAPPAQRMGDPLVEELATASGEALRVRQLLLDPQPDDEASVALSLVYVWESPLPDTVVVLDAWFALPDEGALVLPSFDALAATLTMRPS